ncbi:hypothetical protein H4S02_008330 [Coemansia sp. RSA 2611]|nr:hypothetical protein H4S02_008330 [Coemansia sp. RSA 2611]
MSTDAAASIIFGDAQGSYAKQQIRVDVMKAAVRGLEAQFLASVRNHTTRRSSNISNEERELHEELRRSLGRTRLQLNDEVKLLQWIRRRHNMAVINRKAHSRYLVF